MDEKQTYSLCPKAPDARQKLYEGVRQLAAREKAEIIDRSSGAQRELSDIGSDVLRNTGGDTVLVTVEKAGEFRVSVTNLGLKEKLALAVRLVGSNKRSTALNQFMNDLGVYWTIQEVEGGVTDDPPC